MQEARIIFVGMHRKPGKEPLDSSTKSGKIIDRIIEQISNSALVIVKSNLYDIERLPEQEEKLLLKQQWLNTYRPQSIDTIVLLGAYVQQDFPTDVRVRNLVKIPHPASKRSEKETNEYIQRSVSLILF